MREPGSILTLVTAPVGCVVSTTELREVLRFNDTTDEELFISNILEAAEEYVQGMNGRQLLTAIYDYKLPAFPCNEIVWPKPPLKSVTSVSWFDSSGVEQTMTTDDYVVEIGTDRANGFIRPADGTAWPTTRCEPFAVIVRGTCGYGASKDVPEAVRQQIRILAVHWFSNRSAVGCSGQSALPLAFEALENFNRTWEFV